MPIALSEIVVKESASIREAICYAKIIPLTQMLKAGLTRALANQRSKHIIEQNFFEPLRLVNEVFL
jgi:hypothetical protein